MTYNLLNFEDENDREANFISILDFVEPDLIIAEEVVGQTGFSHFKSDVLDIYEIRYSPTSSSLLPCVCVTFLSRVAPATHLLYCLFLCYYSDAGDCDSTQAWDTWPLSPHSSMKNICLAQPVRVLQATPGGGRL